MQKYLAILAAGTRGELRIEQQSAGSLVGDRRTSVAYSEDDGWICAGQRWYGSAD